MKHTKKILAALLCVTLLLGLAACAGSDTGIPTLKQVQKDWEKNDGQLSEEIQERLRDRTMDEFKEAWGDNYGTDLAFTELHWRLPDGEHNVFVSFPWYADGKSTSARVR